MLTTTHGNSISTGILLYSITACQWAAILTSLFAEDGTYTVSSYLQCNAWGIFSGFVNFDTSLVWAVDDMSNFVFTLSHSGHVCPDNDGWYLDEQNDDLRRNWPSIAARSYAVVQASVNLKVWDLIGKILEYIGTAVGIVSGTEEITKKKDSRGGNGNTM